MDLGPLIIKQIIVKSEIQNVFTIIVISEIQNVFTLYVIQNVFGIIKDLRRYNNLLCHQIRNLLSPTTKKL